MELIDPDSQQKLVAVYISLNISSYSMTCGLCTRADDIFDGRCKMARQRPGNPKPSPRVGDQGVGEGEMCAEQQAAAEV